MKASVDINRMCETTSLIAMLLKAVVMQQVSDLLDIDCFVERCRIADLTLVCRHFTL